jgi:hypothetical protein
MIQISIRQTVSSCTSDRSTSIVSTSSFDSAYLEGVGVGPSRAPPIAAARPHPQREFDYAS